MRLIVKGEEPEEWKEYRQTPGAGYEAKKCLREALYKEQGGSVHIACNGWITS